MRLKQLPKTLKPYQSLLGISSKEKDFIVKGYSADAFLQMWRNLSFKKKLHFLIKSAISGQIS